MISNSKAILVIGATGKQGGAVIRSLLASKSSPPFTIIAATRNPESASAKRLASHSNISLVKGDLDDCDALLAIASSVSPVWGVFSVQPFVNGKSAQEESRGKALIDAATKSGVKHFVYTSADRGVNSDTTATTSSIFQVKYRIELYLKEKAVGSRMTWTILRPTGFFENLSNDFPGKIFATVWKTQTIAMQFVSTKDIGDFAALAFINSSSSQYSNKAISLAGDELTFAQGNEVFQRVVGKDLPALPAIFGTLMKWMVGDLGDMMKWLNTERAGADIAKLQKAKPDLLDFEAWLKTESGFVGTS